MPPTTDVPQEPKKEPAVNKPVDIASILLPAKEVGPNKESASRINAGALLAQEQSATLLPPQPEGPAAPAVPAVPQPKKGGESTVRPLQTYKGDLESVVTDQHVSVVSIAAAEATRRGTQPLQTESAGERGARIRSYAMIAVGVVLVLLAAGLIAVAVSRFTSTLPSVEAPQAPFIFVDESTAVTVSEKPTRGELMTQLQVARSRVRISLGLISWVAVGRTTTDGTPPAGITARELLSILAPTAPAAFVRTLQDTYLFGVHSFDENQPFLILQVDSYETAYAGMLEWERTMRGDLAPLFNRNPSPRINSAVTLPAAATSSAPLPFIQTGFVDKIVENRDTRAMLNDAGDILLLWTFLSRSTLLITTNEYTLREVVSRINSAPVVPIPRQ